MSIKKHGIYSAEEYNKLQLSEELLRIQRQGDGGGTLGTSPSLPQVGPGIKHDQEKPDMSLLSSIALTKLAQVMTFGKKKYSAHNWRGGIEWDRVLSACMRHITAYNGGEDKDPETGLSHIAHAMCCLMFLLEYEETHKGLDNRYKGLTNATQAKGT